MVFFLIFFYFFLSFVQNHRDGELVLVDFGAEYHGYCSDVTRVWPVNGKFSSVQAALYNAVLNVNKKCIAVCIYFFLFHCYFIVFYFI